MYKGSRVIGHLHINYHLAIMPFGQTAPKLSKSAKLFAARARPPLPSTYIRLYNVARRVLRMLMHVKLDTA